MKKKWKILIAVILVLVIIRLILPSLVKRYVNKTLDGLDGYSGHVEDIDLNLYRGAYIIQGVDIVKTGDSIPVPFLSVNQIDLSVHWNALFKGTIAGEVIFYHPVLNFATSKEGNENVSQDGSGADWVETLDELMPLQINRFEIINGKLSYKDFTTEPKVDIGISDLDLLAENLSNVEDKEKDLPSSLSLTGTSIGNGRLNIQAKLNILKTVPDFDFDLKFEQVDLPSLNDFIKAYTKVDVEKGTFSLYSEMAADSGMVKGYIKPVIEDMQVLNWEDENDSFLNTVWQSVVGLFTSIFKNQPKDRFATQTPVEGDLNNLDVGVWPAVWNIFKNAFIEAITKKVEGTIDFEEDLKETEDQNQQTGNQNK